MRARLLIRFLTVAAFVLSQIVSATPASASTGAATVYRVTIQEIDVSRDGGTTWIPVSKLSSAFDIASTSAGSIIGGYAAGSSIEDGTYNALRVIISNTITVKGTALNTFNGRTYCTDDDGTPENSFTNAATCPSAPASQAITVAAAPPAGFPAGVSLDLANARILITNTNFRLTVLNGQGGTFRIAFDVSAGVGVVDNGVGTMYPGPPVVTLTQTG